MKKSDAVKIAELITREQLGEMFENTKNSNINWKEKSKVNPELTNGAIWNILYPAFVEKVKLNNVIKTNMIWAFGDNLPEALKPVKKERRKRTTSTLKHEDPKF